MVLDARMVCRPHTEDLLHCLIPADEHFAKYFAKYYPVESPMVHAPCAELASQAALLPYRRSLVLAACLISGCTSSLAAQHSPQTAMPGPSVVPVRARGCRCSLEA
mgnify:CR=1 FL=1